jgi:EmrB/QacA subfamily drug resistance transporter
VALAPRAVRRRRRVPLTDSGADSPTRGDEPELVVDFAGEEPAVAWPLLFRQRLARRPSGGRHSPWIQLWTVLIGLLATGFSITILAVSLPTVARDLDASRTLVTWAVTGPFLVMALSMPLLGKLGDLAGHRRVYVVGLFGFAVATVLTAVAWDGISLVVIRIIAAFFGAATGPTSMALIMRSFDERDRVKAIGWWALVAAGGPVLGLVLGGVIVDAIGWRGIFIVQAPIAAVAALAGMLVLHETPRARHVDIDWAGVVTLALASTALLLGLNLAEAEGWTSPVVLGLLCVSPVALACFVAVERRVTHPLVPLQLFSNRGYSAVMVGRTCFQFAYMGGFIITPLLVQEEFGFTVAAASLVMVCRPLTNSLSAPTSGYVAVRVGERKVSLVGIVLLVVSMITFAVGAAGESLALVVVGLLLSGVAGGTATPSLVTIAANTLPEDHLGVGNAAQQMADAIGAVIGIQVLATVQSGSAGTSGFTMAFVAGAAIALAGAAAVVTIPRTDVSRETALVGA